MNSPLAVFYNSIDLRFSLGIFPLEVLGLQSIEDAFRVAPFLLTEVAVENKGRHDDLLSRIGNAEFDLIGPHLAAQTVPDALPH